MEETLSRAHSQDPEVQIGNTCRFECPYPCVQDHDTCACCDARDTCTAADEQTRVDEGYDLESCLAAQLCGEPGPDQLTWDPATKCFFSELFCVADVTAAAQDAGDFLAHVAAGAEATVQARLPQPRQEAHTPARTHHLYVVAISIRQSSVGLLQPEL